MAASLVHSALIAAVGSQNSLVLLHRAISGGESFGMERAEANSGMRLVKHLGPLWSNKVPQNAANTAIKCNVCSSLGMEP